MLQFLSTAVSQEYTFPEPPADGDPIALAIVLAVLAIFAVWVTVSKKKKAAKAPAEQPAEAPAAEPTLAPGSAGQIKLHNVAPKTAAMAMAIVADKIGKPLNEIRFLSIKEVE